jgi:adenylate kinase family enzyme
VKRVLLTGMSGTGKSTVLARLGELGHRVLDTDYGGYTADGLWREERIREVLSADDAEALFISGTVPNQVRFYPWFDHIVLLSAPAPVLAERLATRTTNAYGKRPDELADTLRYLETVEPLLRRSATLEVTTTVPLDDVIRAILDHVRPPPRRSG